MKKFLIIDNRMRKIEKEKLEVLGYELIEVPTKCSTQSPGTSLYSQNGTGERPEPGESAVHR